MPDYTFLAVGLGALAWGAVGALSLSLGLLMDDEPLTTRDVIIAFTFEPLFILVGLVVFSLIIIWLRIYRHILKRKRSSDRRGNVGQASLRASERANLGLPNR